MKTRIFALKVYLALLLFTPLALIPSSGRSALLSSQESNSARPAVNHLIGGRQLAGVGLTSSQVDDCLRFLSPRELKMLAADSFSLRAGGQERTSPLQANEAAAIVLTLLILGCVFGFVEQNR